MIIIQTIGWILLIILVAIGIFYLGVCAGAEKVEEWLVTFSKDELIKLKEDIEKVLDGTETVREFKEKYNRRG